MKDLRIQIWFLAIFSLLLMGCGGELCDDDNQEFFSEFENNLKIDPVTFSMASEIDTVRFRTIVDFDGFTTSSCIICLCGPTEFENYSATLGDGTLLNLFKDGFEMQLFLFFNEERFSEFQLKEIDGEYKFFEPFSDVELEEYNLEILPIFVFKDLELENTVRIQAKNNGQIIEELIYQRENGILQYYNFLNEYGYEQIE